MGSLGGRFPIMASTSGITADRELTLPKGENRSADHTDLRVPRAMPREIGRFALEPIAMRSPCDL